MQTFKQPTHTCQIDCTNHDEVINSLELKSKDLYYFWRNYQWLYNKYYSQQKNVTKKQVDISVQLQQIQEEKDKYVVENRKLKMEVELLKKQVQLMNTNTNSKKIQEQYQRQIARLNTKCQEYEKIREKQAQQIVNLNSALKDKQRAMADFESKCKRDFKKQQQMIVQLQTTIDGLRAKIMSSGNTGAERISQLEQKYRRQTQKVQILLKNLEQKCYQLLEYKLNQTKTQLLNQFPEIISRFAHSDLSEIITEEQYEEYQH